MLPANVEVAKATNSSWLRPSTDKAPRFQIERTSYGFRYAAIRRPIRDEETHDYIRTTVYIAPYTALIPPNSSYNVATVLTPEDDNTTIFYFIAWAGADKPGIDADTWRKFNKLEWGVDVDAHFNGVRTRDNLYGQDRAAMKAGNFTGIIQDVGGPTANMYGFECERKSKQGACPDKRCLYPATCAALKPNHGPQLELLKRLRHIPGVRKVFMASGIRPDLIAADTHHGARYIDELAANHVSGQLKLAPEHSEKRVLDAMGKPHTDALLCFKERFDAANKKHGLKQFLTYYFIAAHPECSDDDMQSLKRFATKHLHLAPEQVQIFTPTPSTWSTAMYYTGTNPFTFLPAHVTRGLRAKQEQKDILAPPARL